MNKAKLDVEENCLFISDISVHLLLHLNPDFLDGKIVANPFDIHGYL